MRLDIFLKLSRLIKRRSMAKKYCDHHLVEVNHQPAKAGKEIKSGDEVTLKYWNKTLTVRVLDIPSKGMKTKDSPAFYTIISEHLKESPDEIY